MNFYSKDSSTIAIQERRWYFKDEDGVLVTVVIELVVASQGQESSDTNTIGEEDLSASI